MLHTWLTRGTHHRFTEGQQAGAHNLFAALLAGCVCSVLILPAVCSGVGGFAASAFGSRVRSRAGGGGSAAGGAPGGSAGG